MNIMARELTPTCPSCGHEHDELAEMLSEECYWRYAQCEACEQLFRVTLFTERHYRSERMTQRQLHRERAEKAMATSASLEAFFRQRGLFDDAAKVAHETTLAQLELARLKGGKA